MNSPVTSTWVVNESGERFMNSVQGIPNFNRSLDDQFRAHDGSNVGYTVLYRLPNTYTVRRGQAWQPQAVIDSTTPVTLSYQDGVDFAWSSAQATQELDRIRERYINPAADAIASDADMQSMLDVYASVNNAVGTPGTVPATSQLYTDAIVKILDGSGNAQNVKAVLDTLAASRISNAQAALFNPSGAISAMAKTGRIQDKYLGISEWFQDQNMPTHTTGAFTSSTPVVAGASQTGSSLNLSGFANSQTNAVRKGDVFTVAAVNGVNPMNKQSTSRLLQFVATADASSDGSGLMTVNIYPSIITSGPLQTVLASPANLAAVSIWSGSGTYAATATPSKQSLVFTPDAFCFVMADLVDPVAGAKASFARSKDFGISIRFLQTYMMNGDQNGSRLDLLFGAAPLQPRLAARVVG
jgi:hypothetical protein